MPISRKQFVAGTAALAAAANAPILPAVGSTVHPFRGTALIQALKSAATVNASGRYGGGFKPYYYFTDLPEQRGAHTGGFPRWERIVVGKDEVSGRWLAAIPMACGGTAGVTITAVFADSISGPIFMGAIRQGHKQGVFFQDGALHAVTAAHQANDCNARPSRYRIGRYRVIDDAVELEHDMLIHSTALHDRAHTLASQTLFDVANLVPDGRTTHRGQIAS